MTDRKSLGSLSDIAPMTRALGENPEDATISRILLEQLIPRVETMISRTDSLEDVVVRVESATKAIEVLQRNHSDVFARVTAMETQIHEAGKFELRRVRLSGAVSVGASIGAAVFGFFAAWANQPSASPALPVPVPVIVSAAPSAPRPAPSARFPLPGPGENGNASEVDSSLGVE